MITVIRAVIKRELIVKRLQLLQQNAEQIGTIVQSMLCSEFGWKLDCWSTHPQFFYFEHDLKLKIFHFHFDPFAIDFDA